MTDLPTKGIQKLIDKCPPGKHLAEHLAEESRRLNGIKLRLRSAHLRSEAIRKKHEEEQKEIQKEIGVIRSQCLHEDTQDHRSGVDSSDNYTDCTICGKVIL